jgi:hypothetical protein
MLHKEDRKDAYFKNIVSFTVGKAATNAVVP